MTVPHLLAHSGGFGWDEALFMALPVLVLLVLLRQAKKKAAEEEAAGDTAGDESTERTSGDG